MTFVRNMWYVAAWARELGPSGPIGRTVIGDPIAFYRRRDGTIIAIEDRCPHRHAPLSLGRVEGDDIRCLYHGLLFGSDGVCKAVPGSSTTPPNSTARTYPVAERASWIWVWTGDPALADVAQIPDFHGLDDPAWVTRADALDYAADYQLIHDNLCDLSHLDFVHETTLGFASGSVWADAPPRVTTLDNGIAVERWFIDQTANPGAPEPHLVDTYSRYHFLLPGVFLMTTRLYPRGTAAACAMAAPGDDHVPIMTRIDQQAVTPIASGQTRYLYAAGIEARIATPDLIEAVFAVVNAAFAEDKTIIEAQQRIWNLTPADAPKAFIAQDKAPAIFRKIIARRLADEAGV